MFSIISPLIEEILRREIVLNLLICNQINLATSYMCVKSKLEKLRGQRAVPIKSHKFWPFPSESSSNLWISCHITVTLVSVKRAEFVYKKNKNLSIRITEKYAYKHKNLVTNVTSNDLFEFSLDWKKFCLQTLLPQAALANSSFQRILIVN